MSDRGVMCLGHVIPKGGGGGCEEGWGRLYIGETTTVVWAYDRINA